jgi:hypothetical protein
MPQFRDELHEKIVREVLCRWWYCMPDWPPPTDWSTELKRRKYREVQVHEWEAVEDVVDGLRKVYAIGHYPGLFRNIEGEIVDCRPQESCPSYNNMARKDKKELLTLLSKAFANQIASLVHSGCPHGEDDKKLKAALEKRHAQTTAAVKKYGGQVTEIPKVPEFPCTAAPAKQGPKGTPAKSPESKTPSVKASPAASASASAKKAPSPPEKASPPTATKSATPKAETPAATEGKSETPSLPVESQPS